MARGGRPTRGRPTADGVGVMIGVPDGQPQPATARGEHAGHRAARIVDEALDTLGERRLFRQNAFRVTGLPIDATARQVRRAREESRGRFYVPPSGAAHAPLPPSDDEAEVRAAFEVLADPVARLAHEVLWVAPEADDPRTRAVRDLCAALEGTAPDGTVRVASAARQWGWSLKAWARILIDDATWQDVRRRAEALDDPRLTPGVLRALRRRLPEYLVGTAVGVAARQVRTLGTGTGTGGILGQACCARRRPTRTPWRPATTGSSRRSPRWTRWSSSSTCRR